MRNHIGFLPAFLFSSEICLGQISSRQGRSHRRNLYFLRRLSFAPFQPSEGSIVAIEAVVAWHFRFSIGNHRLAATGSTRRQRRTRFPKLPRKRRRRDNARRCTSV